MTITSPYTPASFNGSGTTGPFSFTFRILDKTNIKVEKVVGTTVTTLTEGVGAGQYSIVLVAAGLSGGQITLGTALAIGERLIVSRVTPRTQLEKLADLRRFNAEIHERAFDKATMVIQETEQIGSSAVKFPTTDTPGLNQTLPVDAARANKVMGFDALGQPIASNLSVAQLDGFAQAVIDVQNNKNATDANVITTGNNVTAAQNAQAAAESAAAGMKWRPSVRVATTGNITLSGTQTIDGVGVIAGDAVLVWQQSAPAQNGVYIVAAGAWSRRADADTWVELISQAVSVEEGATLADFSFICTVNSGGTIGSTAVTWSNSFNAVRDGGVSTSAKIVDGIITFVKTAASSIATTAEIIAGTASKFMSASAFAPLLYSTQVRKNTAQSITTATTTTLNFDIENWDDDGWHDNVTNNSRITVNFSGRVRVTSCLDYGNQGNCQSRIYLLQNGSIIKEVCQTQTAGSQEIAQSISEVFSCTSGDYFEVQVFQNTGGSINTIPARTTFTVERVK